MKSAISLLIVIAICFPLKAEIITELDETEWKTTEQEATKKEKSTAIGRCFIADAKTKMKDAAPLMEVAKASQPYAIRVALRDQEGNGGVLSPLPAGAKPKGLITMVTCDPRGFDVGTVRVAEEIQESQVYETGRMTPDFEGLEAFLGVLKAGIKRANDENTPAFASVIVRSETSWGQMVRMVQLLNSVGFRHAILRIDDSFGGLDIEVKQDPRVAPPENGDAPEAINRQTDMPMPGAPAQAKKARIIINIFDDGTIKDEKSQVLASDEEITQYVKREKERHGADQESILHLRGTKDAAFRHARRVTRLAESVGVTKVNFATFEVQK